MAFAGRQFQSLRRSLRRSTRKRTYDLSDSTSSCPKKRRSIGDENVKVAELLLQSRSDAATSEDPTAGQMRLWSGSKSMDNARDIVEDLDVFYVRQLAVSLQDHGLQKKIDLEIKMREGTKKLLAACNRELQLLEASKALLVSNTRVLVYMTELQQRKTAQYVEKKGSGAKGSPIKSPKSPGGGKGSNSGLPSPCKGKVIVSDIRIPLFWKDADHLKNKGDHHRYAVFCLLKMGSDISSTQMVTNVDRTATDVIFEDSFVFNDVSPGFQCSIEVYSYNLHDDMTIASTPQKIRRKINSLSSSVGKTVGRKLHTSLSTGYHEESSEIPGTPLFHLVARAHLTVDDANPLVKTHNLNLERGILKQAFGHQFLDDNIRHHCFPLFGNFCCRLAARPNCTGEVLSKGLLHFQEKTAGLPSWRTNLWGILEDGHLKLWAKAEEVSLNAQPSHTVTISKDTSIKAKGLSSHSNGAYPHVLEVDGGLGEECHLLAAESKEELERWRCALDQLVTDQGSWRNACHTAVGLITPGPRRSSMESDRTGSLYDEMSISTDLPSQDDSEDENVFIDSPASNLRSQNSLTAPTKPAKKPIFSIPKILVRRETNV